MEKENKSNWEMYKNVGLAAHFAKSDSTQHLIPGALEQFVADRKDSIDKGNYRLLVHSLTHEKGIEGILQSYLPDYIEQKDNTTIGQLTSDYDKIISEYLSEENSKIVKEIFGRFGSYKLKDIKSKLKEISWKLTGYKEGYQSIHEDELKKLEKEATQYDTIVKKLEEYQDTYFDELTPAAVKKANKQKHDKSAEELKQIFY